MFTHIILLIRSCVILAPMNTGQAYYLTKIKEDLSLKQRNNPHYSLRAYARDVGIHPATLSQILKGKRPLPLKDSEAVALKLNLGPKEKTLFVESLLRNKSAIDQIKISDFDTRLMLDESYYQIIAEWEHYALLELFHLKQFNCTKEDVARHLNLTMNRTEVVINNLMVCGLLEVNQEGKLQKVYSDIRTTEDISSQALKESHKETLQLGKEKIEEIAIEMRDFSSSTLAIDLKKIPEAKIIIREFRQKMATLLKDGDKTDVYQLAIQFYPLTKLEKKIH